MFDAGPAAIAAPFLTDDIFAAARRHARFLNAWLDAKITKASLVEEWFAQARELRRRYWIWLIG